MKKSLFLFFLLLLPFTSFAQQEQINAGIINGLWFSEDLFFAGDGVTIYTAIQNTSKKDLSGTIEFLLNDEVFDSQSFYIKPDQLVHIASTDWIATIGIKNFETRITEATHTADGSAEIKTVKTYSSSDVRTVDADNDNDLIGDATDPDDDNDGYSDAEEILAGTGPLDPDSFPVEIEEITTEEPETTEQEGIILALDAFIDEEATGTLPRVISGAAKATQLTIRGADSVQNSLAERIYSSAENTVVSAGAEVGNERTWSPLWEQRGVVLSAPEANWWDKLYAVLLLVGGALFYNLFTFTLFILFILYIIRKIYVARKYEDVNDGNFWD